MKTQKLTQKNTGKSATNIVAGAVGAMASDGLVGAVPIDNKNLVKAGVVIASIAGAALLKGNDIACAALTGMGVMQTANLVRDNAQKALPQATGEGVNKFLHDAFGNKKITASSSAIKATAAGFLPVATDHMQLAHPNMQLAGSSMAL